MSRKKVTMRGFGNHMFFMQEIEGIGLLTGSQEQRSHRILSKMQFPWFNECYINISRIVWSLSQTPCWILKGWSQEPTVKGQNSSLFFPRSIIAVMQWVAFCGTRRDAFGIPVIFHVSTIFSFYSYNYDEGGLFIRHVHRCSYLTFMVDPTLKDFIVYALQRFGKKEYLIMLGLRHISMKVSNEILSMGYLNRMRFI